VYHQLVKSAWFLASVVVLVGALGALGACHPGGQYAKSSTFAQSEDDKGETNGRMFDFVSNKPEGDDWQIRIRGSSIWASYAHEDQKSELGTKNLTAKETAKIWDLIDKVDIPSREKGQQDDDSGFVQLRLREPGEEQHDIYTIYVSRETEDDDVLDLAEYLRTVVSRHFSEKPNF
jgi:hypothetical protein